MKRTQLFLGGVLLLGLLALTGCGGAEGQQVHELSFSLEGITSVTLSYDEEPITFLAGTGDQLVVREYMTQDKAEYHAKVTEKGTSIQIQEGGKPLLQGDFSRWIEVYLPASYGESLTVTTTDGAIDLTGAALQLRELRVDSTAGLVQVGTAAAGTANLSTTQGRLELADLTGDEITLTTTNGSILCDRLEGEVDCRSTGGEIQIRRAWGSGSYRAENSGELSVAYEEVTGDLTCYNKNDGIWLSLPPGLSFAFEATTKNGQITTTFPVTSGDEGRSATATVGDHPSVTVRAETKNGDITVEQ